MSAAAIATLSDSTRACIGIVTVSCSAAMVTADTPAPSPPSTIAVGSRRWTFGRGVPPRGTAAMRRTPSSRADATTSDSEPRAAIGSRNVPPMPPRSAFQLNGFADPSIATTPDAPNAAAARMIAPTFPGSCRPASTSTSGRSVTVAMTTRTSVGRARAIATTPEGCCTGLSAASTGSVTVRTRPPRFLTSLAMRATGERTLFNCSSENAAISTGMSQASASCTRCSPSSKTSPEWPADVTVRDARARSRKRLTIPFWRLLIPSISASYSALLTALACALFSATITIVKARLLKKFEDEIQQLDKELKTELPREIKRARELGDLRENAEYQAAKERQRLVASRISMLQMRVSQIQLMNLDRIPHGKVGFGSTVTLHDPAGQTIVYSLVMPEDANVEEGMISTASPIGRALLNKEEGDDIVVTRPDGTERRFELVKLVTIHDV